MQLPVDLGKLFGETEEINEAREVTLSLSVYIDDSAPAELIAHVRNVFASSSPHVRLTVTYLGKEFIPHPTDDLAVIVAGESAEVGASAQAIRSVGVPVMVATTSPTKVNGIAASKGAPIPDGDVAAPAVEEGAEEPIEFTEEAAFALNERMGAWIASVCYDKRLALAIAFPFMRRALARESVQITALENAGLGLIPFIPGADLPLMTLNQAKMALQIAAAYGNEMSVERIKELAVVIGGAYLSRALARELIEFVPILGFAIRTGVAYASTSAMGYAIIEYFEGGEDATGVANVATKASEFGVRTLAKARDIAVDPSQISFERAGEIADIAREKAADYVPKALELVNEYAPVVKGTAANALGKASGWLNTRKAQAAGVSGTTGTASAAGAASVAGAAGAASVAGVAGAAGTGA